MTRAGFRPNFNWLQFLVGASAPTIHLGSYFLCRPDVQLSVVSFEV